MSSRGSAEEDRWPASQILSPAEFQRQWQAGQHPRIDFFVSERPAMLVNELAAIARIDLRHQWRCGEPISASDYLARFPRLRADAALAIDLIYTEFLVREELGEDWPLSHLQREFPEYAEELTAQIEFHLALETIKDPPASGAETQPSQETPRSRANSTTRLPSLGSNYEVLAEIGRGGMGVVYRARQVTLNRFVALKMVRGAEYASAELLDRFRAEAEAVARLHHPQIVQIYDYGEHDGLPYLALELVEGGTLATRLDGTPWPVEQAAVLVEMLARAVEFAHQRGVLHRDLKPANVLVVADTIKLQVKITDFGLAKAFRDRASEQTQSGALLGTPSYMAPEQAAGRTRQIGPAADVYALGAIFYELLTGRPPFRGETPMATLQQVLTSEPVSIQLLAPRVPRDVVTICTKCLSREPEQRYRSAADLADDLARVLTDQPIRARPISNSERAWRWCRRNPALTLLGGTVALLLLAVAGVSSLSSIRLRTQLEKTARAEGAERTAKLGAQIRLWDSYLTEITARTGSRQIGQRWQSLATVEKASALLPEIGRTPERVLRLRNAAIAALALPDLIHSQSPHPWWTPAKQASFCAEADRCSVQTSDGALRVYRLSDGKELCTLQSSGVIGDAHMSADGRFVVLIQGGPKVWRIDGPVPTVVWEEPDANFFTFAPDSRHAAVCRATGTMQLLDLESGQEVRQLGQGGARSAFSFHAPSERIAVLGPHGFQIISWNTGEVLTELPLPDSTHPFNNLRWVAWHPSGDYLLVGPFAGGAVLLNVASGARVMVYPHRSKELTVKFFNEGELLCTYSYLDGSLHLWHTATGRELLGDTTFSNFAWDRSSGSSKLFRWGGDDLEVWEVTTASECISLLQGLQPDLVDVHSLAISPDSQLVAVSRTEGLDLWDLASGRHWLQTGIRHGLVKFTENGDLIVSCKHSVTRWPRSTQLRNSTSAEPDLEIAYGPPRQLTGGSDDCSFAINPAGDVLAVEPPWSGSRVLRAEEPENVVRLLAKESANRMAISGDGHWVVVANAFVPGATAFNAQTGQHVADFSIGSDCLPLFSPDNRWLALSRDGVRVWRTSDWRPATEIHSQGRTQSAHEIAFSPDSRVLAVGQPSGVIRLTDPATGDDWAALTDPDKSPGAFLAISPDQTKLVAMAASEHGAPRVWNLAAIRRELDLRGLDWPQEVLHTHASTESLAPPPRLDVKFDIGNFLKKEVAVELVSKSGNASPSEALALLQQAVESDPECGNAHNDLAWLFAAGPTEMRNAELSLVHARRAVALEPGHQGNLNTLGIALCRNALYDEAISVLERSLALSVAEGASLDLLFLALAHAGKGDAKSANGYYSRSMTWYDSHNRGLSVRFREDFSRLSDETRAAIMP